MYLASRRWLTGGAVTAISLLIHPKQGQILPSIPFFLLGLLAGGPGGPGDEVGASGMSTGGGIFR